MSQQFLQTLREDHIALDWMLIRLQVEESSAGKAALFGEFAKLLGAHISAIERVVLPALHECGWPSASDELARGNNALRTRLAEALAMGRDTPEFERALSALHGEVRQQAVVELTIALPALADGLSDAQIDMLVNGVRAELQRWLGESPSSLLARLRGSVA